MSYREDFAAGAALLSPGTPTAPALYLVEYTDLLLCGGHETTLRDSIMVPCIAR